MGKPDESTIADLHRYFAVESNNAAWDLLEKGPLDDNEQESLIRHAHAAALHWSVIGDPIHQARADMLLANAHSAVGDGAHAVRYAARCQHFCETDDPTISDWDRAFAMLQLAFATGVAGDEDSSKRALGQAGELAGKIESEQDRKYFEAELAKVKERFE